jgi:DNA-binding GntR family transcriptional regulator
VVTISGMKSNVASATSAPVRAQTRSWDLKEEIEEDIATGALAPGSRLDETELAERFGVSRTPVREALIQLASMGILQMRPRRGAVVPDLSPQRLVEMLEVMAELEAMCGRLAARRMSGAEHKELVQAHQACEAARNSEDSDAYYYRNETFHHLIYAGTHNTFLSEQTSALHKRLRPYRRLQLRVRDRMSTSFQEHQRVVDAILAGDAELTAEALRNHVLVQGERFGDLMACLNRLK